MFSIIIPTLNNLRYLKLCVESIKKNSKFINEIIEAVPFSGKNGLKDRTGLLSYKYDVG